MTRESSFPDIRTDVRGFPRTTSMRTSLSESACKRHAVNIWPRKWRKSRGRRGGKRERTLDTSPMSLTFRRHPRFQLAAARGHLRGRPLLYPDPLPGGGGEVGRGEREGGVEGDAVVLGQDGQLEE